MVTYDINAKIVLKLCECFISHVTSCSAYMLNKTLKKFQNYFKVILFHVQPRLKWQTKPNTSPLLNTQQRSAVISFTVNFNSISSRPWLRYNGQETRWHQRTTIPLASKSLQNRSAAGWHCTETWRFPTSTEFPESSRSSRWSLSSKWDPATVEIALIGVLTARWRAKRSELD